MSEQHSNPAHKQSRADQWDQQMAATGRVVNGTNWATAMSLVTTLSAAIIAIGVFVNRDDPDFGPLMIVGLVLAAMFISGVVMLWLRITRSPIVVDHEGMRRREVRIPWQHIESLSTFTSTRSGDALQVNLNDQGWYTLQQQSGKSRRAMNTLSEELLRARAVYWSYGVDDGLDEFVAWLNDQLHQRTQPDASSR